MGKNLSVTSCEIVENAPLQLVRVTVKDADFGQQLDCLRFLRDTAICFYCILHRIIAFKFRKTFSDI